MNRKTVSVGTVCEAPMGDMPMRVMETEHLGNHLTFLAGPWKPELLREYALYCRKHHMRFSMDEMISRMTADWRQDYLPRLEETISVLREFPDVVDSCSIMSEYGGVRFYWPESTVATASTKPGKVDTFEDAEKGVMQTLQKAIERSKAKGVPGPFKSVEARGLAVPFYLRAGIQKIEAEMLYNEESEILYAGVKGAARAFGLPDYGIDLATLWYAGNVYDELWFSRWRTSLYHAFLRGGDPIYAEHGIFGFDKVLGTTKTFDDPLVVRYRGILSEFADFVQKHPRPDAFPEASVAVMQGRFDGYAGVDQTHLWGLRRDDRFRVGVPERSWELFEQLYHRRNWENRDKTGSADFSGNPPLGQADIIPYDTPDEVLAQYKFVIFLGRNSMDDVLYKKLLRYVRGGGQLLITAAHFDTAITPDAPYQPFRGGDWHELCGVRMKSEKVFEPYGLKFKKQPACGWQVPLWTSVCDPKYPGFGFRTADLEADEAELFAAASDRFNEQDLNAKADSGQSATNSMSANAEDLAWQRMEKHGICFCHAPGKGCTVLLNTLDYPGASGVRKLYFDLMEAGCNANRPYPRVECSDRVRYAVYPGTPRTLYVLNTEENLDQQVIIHFTQDRTQKATLKPGELIEASL